MRELDLLVLGGGMAGMTAAARAAQAGARVAVVEAAGTVGGSAINAEFIWTAPDVETMAAENPGGDPALGSALVEDYPAAMEWVRSLGVNVDDPVALLGFGIGSKTDMVTYFRTCQALVEGSEGSAIHLEARPSRLLVEDGAVVGAEVADGSELRAASTLLATGGFAGDAELRARHIHPNAGGIPLRANPHSAGAGLRLGEEAGAAMGLADAGFYGHLMPYRVTVENPGEFAMMTFYHSEHGVLVNLEGERFLDETAGDQHNAIATLEQPEARALLITDERVHREWMLTPYVEGFESFDKFALAYRRGARCAVAADLEEFEALPPEWGYPGGRVRQTLERFNAESAAGAADPPRSRDSVPLLDPPYYVIDLTAAITFSMAGVRIDAGAHALSGAGEPVPGLLAAGCDAGGLYKRAYAGGLAPALVFGLRAAHSAIGAQSGV